MIQESIVSMWTVCSDGEGISGGLYCYCSDKLVMW